MTDIQRADTIHALLIGIDCYLPNQLPDGSYYPSLGGCVRDVSHVEDFLRTTVGVAEDRIVRLTASNGPGDEPVEPREQWPTYENMVAAFKRVTDAAQPGDQVVIHYSGHGGRATTAFPALKGDQALDETLVPTDIGDGTRYLRDIELAHLLAVMVDKGLIVSTVLDSCHSGGATREVRGDGRARVRGIRAIDTTARPTDSLVASDAELARTWPAATATTRGFELGSGWLPEPRGYVLLAACRPSESAFEYPFDGVESNGALTYWLLDCLKQLGPELTYQRIYHRIVAKVHSQFQDQTPQLEGEGDRIVFGVDRVAAPPVVNVMAVDGPGKRVHLNAGLAHGIRKGAQFAIYPADVLDAAQVDRRLALVEVQEPGATDSWAAVTAELRPEPIEPGARALLLDVGSIRVRQSVRALRRPNLAGSLDQETALTAVENAVDESGGGFLRQASDDEPADFQVVVSEDGAYEIWDAAGGAVPNLPPGPQASAPDAAAATVRRLVHLARYKIVQQLDNQDPMSPLAGKLVVELAGVQEDYEPGDRPDPQPLPAGSAPVLDVGTWAFIRIRNQSAQVLNVAVLDLQPDWGISQVFPDRHDTDWLPLDPGEEAPLLPLRAGAPAHGPEGADLIKVLGTVGPTSFRWLELPTMEQPDSRAVRTRGAGPSNPLEELFSAITTTAPTTRNLNPAAYASGEWAAASIELRVRAPDPG